MLRGGRALQTDMLCVGSTRRVPGTLGLPRSWRMLSPSTLLRLLAALQGAGPALCALPRPQPLGFRFSGPPQRRRLGWACLLCLPRRAAQAARSLTGVLCPGAVRLLPSAVPASVSGCALCPFWEADFWLRPSRRMSTIHNLRKSLVRSWEPVCSLVGGAVSGATFAPFPSPLPPASSRGWASPPPASSSLGLLSPSFWEWAGSA